MTAFATTHVPRKYAVPVERQHDLHPTIALQAAQQWGHQGASLLVLSGEPGTGKSMAAAAALHAWWQASAVRDPWGKLRFFDGRLWIAAVHLTRLQPWSDDVASLEKPGMLVLDDLGEEEGTPKAIAMVSDLITTRFADDHKTIITTNLDGGTFVHRYGTRITDRLRECGLNEQGKARWWVKCSGDSLRGVIEPKPRNTETQVEHVPTSTMPADSSSIGSMGEMAAAWLARRQAAKESNTE